MSLPFRVGAMTTLGDYQALSHLDVDFFELLVREQDSVEDIEGFLGRAERIAIVHAPERMRIDGESMLIDLADEDDRRREAFARRVGEVAAAAERRGLPTVVHPGGVRPHPVDGDALRQNLAASLRTMDGTLWLENMPRRYHTRGEKWFCSLCIRPEEFTDLLPHLDGITLDISHAYLSVEKGGNEAIADFFATLRRHIRHVHLSDARHPDGEGLQLGDGDVDLGSLPRMRNLPVLLEVWNGHLDGGAGFAEALRRVRSSDRWFRDCIP